MTEYWGEEPQGASTLEGVTQSGEAYGYETSLSGEKKYFYGGKQVSESEYKKIKRVKPRIITAHASGGSYRSSSHARRSRRSSSKPYYTPESLAPKSPSVAKPQPKPKPLLSRGGKEFVKGEFKEAKKKGFFGFITDKSLTAGQKLSSLTYSYTKSEFASGMAGFAGSFVDIAELVAPTLEWEDGKPKVEMPFSRSKRRRLSRPKTILLHETTPEYKAGEVTGFLWSLGAPLVAEHTLPKPKVVASANVVVVEESTPTSLDVKKSLALARGRYKAKGFIRTTEGEFRSLIPVVSRKGGTKEIGKRAYQWSIHYGKTYTQINGKFIEPEFFKSFSLSDDVFSVSASKIMREPVSYELGASRKLGSFPLGDLYKTISVGKRTKMGARVLRLSPHGKDFILETARGFSQATKSGTKVAKASAGLESAISRGLSKSIERAIITRHVRAVRSAFTPISLGGVGVGVKEGVKERFKTLKREEPFVVRTLSPQEMPRAKRITKPLSVSKGETILAIESGLKSKVAQGIKTVTSPSTKTVESSVVKATELEVAPSGIAPSITAPPAPVPPEIKPVPLPLPFEFPKLPYERQRGIGLPKPKQLRRYVPSLSAFIFGVTSKKKPRQKLFTGLEIRPIVFFSSKKRRKKAKTRKTKRRTRKK